MFEYPKYTTIEEETKPVEIKIVALGEASFPYIVNVSLVQPPPWGRNATGNVTSTYVSYGYIGSSSSCVHLSYILQVCLSHVDTCNLLQVWLYPVYL